MAVYTEISDREFESVISSYDIGKFVSRQGIKEGIQNTNYLINTSKSKYIATVYEKWTDQKDLPFFISLMEHLAIADIPCPRPIHSKDGEIIHNFKGRPLVIVSYLEGSWPKNVKNHHCEQLGAMLARMHLATESFNGKRDNKIYLKEWNSLLSGMKNDADKVLKGAYKEIIGSLNHVEKNWPEKLPAGIIHADLFPDNVFFDRDEKLSGILDFYFSCNGFFAYDLAITMNAWCFERHTEFNITKAKALLRGYNEVRKLSEKELDCLPILSLGAAIRFLVTRLYDWVNRVEGALVVPKDPLEYLEKLRFHAGVKNHKEYGL